MSKNSCCFCNAVTGSSLVPYFCQTPPREMAFERSIGGDSVELHWRYSEETHAFPRSASRLNHDAKIRHLRCGLRINPKKNFTNHLTPPIWGDSLPWQATSRTPSALLPTAGYRQPRHRGVTPLQRYSTKYMTQ